MRPPFVGASGLPGPGGPNNGATTAAAGAAAAGAAAAGSSSTAKKAAEAAAGAAAAATAPAKTKTFFSSVSDRLAKDSVTLKGWWSSSAAYLDDLKTGQAKITMPVHVDVDFFGPIILAAKREAVRAWRKLPAPAQNAAPYVATAAASGGSAFAWQRRRLLHERARGDLLAARVESLSAERVRLQDACKALRAAAATPRAAADVRSAEAVAAATGAAAAAASAAAEAAKACAVYVTRGGGGGGGGGPPRRTPEN